MVPPGVAIALVGAAGVDGVYIFGVVDVEVDGIDADDAAVLLVELLDFPEVLEPVWVNLEVELVPEGERR